MIEVRSSVCLKVIAARQSYVEIKIAIE